MWRKVSNTESVSFWSVPQLVKFFCGVDLGAKGLGSSFVKFFYGS